MAKAAIQAPIDRPLARSYLREFSGWSTAYPPGLSDPTSLRKMNNVYITREGAARLRPGIRSIFTENWWLGNAGESIVGSFEHFVYDFTGRTALLFAVRQVSGTVSFRVVVYNTATQRFDNVSAVFPSVTFGTDTTYVKYLQIDNKILALSDDPTEPAILFFVGETKDAKKHPASGLTLPAATDAPVVRHPDAAYMLSGDLNTSAFPAAETPTTQTLISSTATDNKYTFAFFYTFETDFGESAASGITTIKTQRGWSQWQFNAPDASGNKTTTIVTDPNKAMDQLSIALPTGQYATAAAQGAKRWNLYMFSWNDSSPVPSVATLVASQDFATTRTNPSWIPMTAAALAESHIVPVPSEDNRQNYSGAPTARQGLAVGDRLVLVNDGENQAVIQWSANVPGEYTNFSPSKGGGRKTLSSGNLLVPLNVQLWQNPQATDTICITCKGLNGYHAAYYMAPASVAGQSDATLIMGFEQTTATPGTISPYGVEVLNNSLYHPLEAELMKSSAANYAINHKTMTTDVSNKWQRLQNKEDIISAQHDGRLYYIVNNPEGEALEPGCMGNEVWVLDISGENPSWSRWTVQGISLRKLQVGDKLYMSLVRPDAIFIFDELAFKDEYASGASTQRRAIRWELETNTLGANRAHDAWALLYQAQVHVGDWIGGFEWGIRGYDVNGYEVEVVKRSHANQNVTPGGWSDTLGIVSSGQDLGDSNDFLLIQRDLMEWQFFARSIIATPPTGGAVKVWDFYGQIDFVQFMIAQLSTNINTELGSIETFEYQRNAHRGVYNGDNITRNGVPMPMNTQRP